MKTINKYYLIAFFPLLFLTTLFVNAEPIQFKEKVQAKDKTIEQVEQVEQGKLIWADLYTSDVVSSLNFYTDTFGWTAKKFKKSTGDYHLLFDGDKAIAGVLERSVQRNKTEAALWVGSVTTHNIQEKVNNAANNKATVILNVHDFALYGKRAVIADPQGAIISLLDLSNSDIAQDKISHKWDWAQLFSTNIKESLSFYHQTFGYNTEKIKVNSNNYYLSQQGEIRASIVKLPASFEQRARWINFVEVDDLSDVLSKATKNKALIFYQPKDKKLAIIADPNGALIGLTELESEK
ncbi:MAG: VOC family protein [Colwellia sp.]|nr:VOC family protein [Colwellia sp.]